MKQKTIPQLMFFACLFSAVGLILMAGQTGATPNAIPVAITIDTNQDRTPISPYIYGTNQPLTDFETFGSRRIGGNRTTALNWETSYSNAGHDYLHHSDLWICSAGAYDVPDAECAEPGGVYTHFHRDSQAVGAYSLVTLQMAGYVSADGDGTVVEGDLAPSDRWDEVIFAKNAPFEYPPDLTDGVVYMDEQVDYYVETFGTAADGGIQGYSLDNEPKLWSNTHPRVHPNGATAAELVTLSAELAKAVKDVDPTAETFGPSLFGYWAMKEMEEGFLNNEGAGYDWFISYYLDKLADEGAADGRRLLDVLDVHWYPEATGDGTRIVFDDAESQAFYEARLQAPRTLWDDSYLEESSVATWNSQDLPLIPRLQESIDTYYPDTKLAITEWQYGGSDHISGGLATADVFGIFGREEVYLATNWQLGGGTDYLEAAFELYLDYDGNGGMYGDTNVMAMTADNDTTSVFASEDADGNLHIILINKSFTEDVTASFDLTSNTSYQSGEVWGFNESSSDITQQAAIASITNNQFDYSVAPMSAHHIILSAGAITPTPTPLPGQATNTPTPTRTPIPSPTPTPVLVGGNNLLTNGDFASITDPWWTYGLETAEVSAAVVDGELVITIGDGGTNGWDIGAGQNFFTLEAGKTYRFSFDGRADADRAMIALVGQREEGTTFTDFTNNVINLTTEMQSFTFDFTMDEGTEWGSAEFQMGTVDNSVVTLDNISLSEVTAAPVVTEMPTEMPTDVPATAVPTNVPPTTDDMLTNGDFAGGIDPWWSYGLEGTDVSAAVVGGELVVTITDGGAEGWEIGAGQNYFMLESGKTYRVTFDAMADSARDIVALVGYREPDVVEIYNYSEETIGLTTEMQTFTYEFTMTEDTDWGSVEFQLGGVDSSVVTMDNVSFVEVAGTTSPPLATTMSNGGTATTPSLWVWIALFGTLSMVGILNYKW